MVRPMTSIVAALSSVVATGMRIEPGIAIIGNCICRYIGVSSPGAESYGLARVHHIIYNRMDKMRPERRSLAKAQRAPSKQ